MRLCDGHLSDLILCHFPFCFFYPSHPTDCNLPGSSVHGISQARILEWVAVSFSRDLPDPGIKPTSWVSSVSSFQHTKFLSTLGAVHGIFPLLENLFHSTLFLANSIQASLPLRKTQHVTPAYETTYLPANIGANHRVAFV